MYRLYILGAGGFGREVWTWIKTYPKTVPLENWQLAGFIDANPNALNGFAIGASVLADPETFVPSDNDRLVCAIGDPKTKLRLGQQQKSRGGIFVTLIHPSAIVGSQCQIGEGCIICPGAVLTTNVILGDFVILNVHSTVGHDATVGSGCTLSGHVDITGGVVLGEGVFLGSHACVLPGTHIGEYAKIGAASVAIRNVPPHVTVFGVPAKKVIVPTKESAE